MSDHPKNTIRASIADGDDSFSARSGPELTCVPATAQEPLKRLNQTVITHLADACMTPLRRDLTVATEQLRRAGYTAQDIAELFVPAVAREMGERWCKDTMSFAEVTIGCSRLLSLLRDLESDWLPDRSVALDGPAMLFLVGKGAFHTLGATVLTGVLRRLGVSARLCVGAETSGIEQIVRTSKFDCVLISASIGESLDSIGEIVDSVKRASIGPIMVIVGGTILEGAADRAKTIRTKTGADHVTNDPTEALKFCGLKHLLEPANTLTSVSLMRRS